MKAILTVIGKDRVGIIAGISAELQNLNINILDVNQTIMEGYFTMIMILDLEKKNAEFDEIKERLLSVAIDLGVDVKIQREEIFNSMHSI